MEEPESAALLDRRATNGERLARAWEGCLRVFTCGSYNPMGGRPERKTVKTISVLYLLFFTVISLCIASAPLLSGAGDEKESKHSDSCRNWNIAIGVWIFTSLLIAGVYIVWKSIAPVPEELYEAILKKARPTKSVHFWGILLFGLGTVTLSFFSMTEFVLCSDNSTVREMAEAEEHLGKDGADEVFLTGLAVPLMTFVFIFLELACLRRFETAAFGDRLCHFLLLFHLVGAHLLLWVNPFVMEIAEGTEHAKSSGSKHTIDGGSESHGWTNSTIANCAAVKDLLRSVQPILYPCTMEFSLLMAGVFISLWMKTPTTTSGPFLANSELHSQEQSALANPADPPPDNSDIVLQQGNPTNNNAPSGTPTSTVQTIKTKVEFLRRVQVYNGFFLFLAAAVIVFIIVQLKLGNTKDTGSPRSNQVHDYLKSFLGFRQALLFAMVWCCLSALGRIVRLPQKAQTTGSNYLSLQVLLLVSAAGLALNCILSSIPIISCIVTGEKCDGSKGVEADLILVDIAMHLLETLFQILLLLEASKRDLKVDKATSDHFLRGLFRFLSATNFLLWTCDTFYDIHTLQNVSIQTLGSLYYGQKTWLMLTRLTFPLTIFFHFHSFLHFHDFIVPEENVFLLAV